MVGFPSFSSIHPFGRAAAEYEKGFAQHDEKPGDRKIWLAVWYISFSWIHLRRSRPRCGNLSPRVGRQPERTLFAWGKSWRRKCSRRWAQTKTHKCYVLYPKLVVNNHYTQSAGFIFTSSPPAFLTVTGFFPSLPGFLPSIFKRKAGAAVPKLDGCSFCPSAGNSDVYSI